MFTATQQKSPELTVLGSLSAVFFVTVLGLACLRTEDTPSPAARCSDDNGDGSAQYVAVGWIHRHFLDCGKDDTPGTGEMSMIRIHSSIMLPKRVWFTQIRMLLRWTHAEPRKDEH